MHTIKRVWEAVFEKWRSIDVIDDEEEELFASCEADQPHKAQCAPAPIEAGQCLHALNYIGADPADFELRNTMFARPSHASIHSIGHIYRTMIGCALLGEALQRPREGLLAFCGAYIHDLARETDGIEPDHGDKAADKYFVRFETIWDKYHLTNEERKQICQAVAQHARREWMTPKDEGYPVMAILKDADALDRCRIGDLCSEWLRYPESHLLIRPIEYIYLRTMHVNTDITLLQFMELINRSQL